MTPFEKANLKHIIFWGATLALAVAFAPCRAQILLVPASFACGGAVLMWQFLSDRNGLPKERGDPEFGDHIAAIFVGSSAALILGFFAAAGGLIKWMIE